MSEVLDQSTTCDGKGCCKGCRRALSTLTRAVLEEVRTCSHETERNETERTTATAASPEEGM